ncbi:unnamed protein product [Acanthosepion pharaonis]|uniref:Uncharacterized protein n=1 Tax=Acanthosepion pharaonis TaxID=158019 RepID=A0A812EDC6_ACAPH|nr:unnamed protein product [Sepia pharaonis]
MILATAFSFFLVCIIFSNYFPLISHILSLSLITHHLSCCFTFFFICFYTYMLFLLFIYFPLPTCLKFDLFSSCHLSYPTCTQVPQPTPFSLLQPHPLYFVSDALSISLSLSLSFCLVASITTSHGCCSSGSIRMRKRRNKHQHLELLSFLLIYPLYDASQATFFTFITTTIIIIIIHHLLSFLSIFLYHLLLYSSYCCLSHASL